jgi:hypothetical protein
MVGLILFAFGLCLAQSGSNSDPRFEKLAKDLYPKAKQEGAVVIYTIWDVEHVRSILDVFNKRFPGINTTYWQGTRSEIIARTLTEFQGDQRTADVILSEGAPVVLRAAGAIEPYDTVQASSLLLHDPTLPTVSLQIMALSYNIKKLKKEDLPKTWEDVINPKRQGYGGLGRSGEGRPLERASCGFQRILERRCPLDEIYPRPEGTQRYRSQEHQRDVSSACRGGVCHLHAITAARRG